ncbi:MAG: DNA-directed RNA polymerase subunit L [Candidatus Woesearchaeota archaeon]
MEVKVVEDSKKKLIFEIMGESHTLANLLEKELWEDEDIVAAGYHVEHPLVAIPRMVVETNGKKTAHKAVEDAVDRLKKKNKDFLKAYSKGIK